MGGIWEKEEGDEYEEEKQVIAGREVIELDGC